MHKHEKLTEYAVLAALSIAVLVAIADTVFDDLIPDKWFIVGIFSILLTITHYALKLISIEEQVKDLNYKVQLNGIRNFQNYEEFYAKLERSVKNAKKELLLTHVRSQPPSSWSASQSYFSYIEEWVQNNPSGSVRRIGACHTPDMLAWSRDENALSEKYKNYYFHVLDWDHPYPLINMAIIDRSEVYIAISGQEVESTHAIKFHDHQSVDAFYDYFQNLWHYSKTLKEHEAGNSKNQ